MVVSLLGISRWSWVNGCLSLVIVFFGAVEASFDHVGANMGPLQGENPKICYQMEKKVGFGITTQAFWTNFLQYKVKNVIPNAIKNPFW